jgi:hypothetical protein
LIPVFNHQFVVELLDELNGRDVGLVGAVEHGLARMDVDHSQGEEVLDRGEHQQHDAATVLKFSQNNNLTRL